MEEMAEDGLDVVDVESAILSGQMVRIERDDPRGIKYVVEGMAADKQSPLGVVGRFTGKDCYLIITVYAIRSPED